MKLPISAVLGGLHVQSKPTPIPGATWFTGRAVGDGWTSQLTPGALDAQMFLTADMLVDGTEMLTLCVALQEGTDGPILRFTFGALPQCLARIVVPLTAADQHQWVYPRAGALLKPTCWGDRVNPARVDRIHVTLSSKPPGLVRWCITPLVATHRKIRPCTAPVLPQGKLLDRLGQSRLRTWPGKAVNASQVNQRIREQWKAVPRCAWPRHFSRWGGWKSRKLSAGTGFFGVQHDGRRWWLVDPDGFAFWSVGVDCVSVDQTNTAYAGLQTALTWRPNPRGRYADIYQTDLYRYEPPGTPGHRINYLAANLIRALGNRNWREKANQICLAQMKQLGFNTMGNWSDWKAAPQAGFPYVRPLDFHAPRSGCIFREFPDIYHPDFAADVQAYAAALAPTANDPALIGYFLMNEPSWGGFSSQTPAAGMLFNTRTCHTRRELARWLQARYGTAAKLAAAWKMPVGFSQVQTGLWRQELGPAAQRDLREFSTIMVGRYFGLLAAACRRTDPHHLNLGVRYNAVPPAWMLEPMKVFDVFSMNCYLERLPRADIEQIHRKLKRPVIIGEFHFGTLQSGLPAHGVARLVQSQADRAAAYRAYIEDAAALPACVGVHWFQWYDQSALGRFDGECYDIGFMDTCNRVYPELAAAAIRTHQRLYPVADGRLPAFNHPPQYLPTVCL